jgi:hypothetical protein
MKSVRDELNPDDFAWLGLPNIEELIQQVENPYDRIALEYPNEDFYLQFLRIHRNPRYFSSFCKHVFNWDLHPTQDAIQQELWKRAFPMLVCSRGWGKSSSLALYCILRCLLVPGTKVVIAGAGFRQAKLVFEEIERFWKSSDVFRSLLDTNEPASRQADRWTFTINGSTIVAIPIGTGEKIRGLRANVIIADEFSAINPEVYQTVIQGFGVVEQNPMEKVKMEAKRDRFREKGLLSEELDKFLMQNTKSNQSIISGTADYDFKHFAKYWRTYKEILKTKGERAKLKEVFGDDERILANTNWKDFSIIRIPVELCPKGFMSEGMIARAKATTGLGIYLMEYGAVFVKDSLGFFKRSLIESCVTRQEKPVVISTGEPVWFDAVIYGERKKTYVMGVDPASERDNFTIVILEVYKHHSRVVYCWSTTRKKFDKLKTEGRTDENDFYSFCCRKIRSLMSSFNCERIAIDSQGGGRAIEQGLHDKSRLDLSKDIPYWEIIDKEDPKPSDKEAGLHIIEMVNFADADYTSGANHGLRKAMESLALLFPRFDNFSLGIASEMDVFNQNKPGVDSLEDCIFDIEELKNELSNIVQLQTPTGRDKWDSPEVIENGKKTHLRKDRYSALLMAFSAAQQILNKPVAIQMNVPGRNARVRTGKVEKTGGIEDCFVAIRRTNQ